MFIFFLPQIIDTPGSVVETIFDNPAPGVMIFAEELNAIRVFKIDETTAGTYPCKIKKGTVMFEHGISMSQVADKMDISLWELMDYIGNTSSMDKEKLKKARTIKRLKLTRELFGV